MDSIEQQETTSLQSAAPLLADLPERLHHHAYVVKDQEANRRFFEDVLGIPLVATWCEKSWRAGTRSFWLFSTSSATSATSSRTYASSMSMDCSPARRQ